MKDTQKLLVVKVSEEISIDILDLPNGLPVVYGGKTTTEYTPTGEVYDKLRAVFSSLNINTQSSDALILKATKMFVNSPYIYAYDNDRKGCACFKPVSISKYGRITLYYQGVYGHPNDIGNKNWIKSQTLIYDVPANKIRFIVN